MPKIPKRRTLADVLEPGFARGYDEFRELVDWSQDQSSLTKEQKAWAFCMERVSVGMIEALNAGEDRFELPPHEMVIELWSAVGTALATINVQAFQMGPEVRRQMLKHLKAGYDRATQSFPERAK